MRTFLFAFIKTSIWPFFFFASLQLSSCNSYRFQADGSHLAACINAGSLALIDAGIELLGIVTAASCACALGGIPCLDVSSREETATIPRLTIATISGRDDIVLTELQNRVHKDHFKALLTAARQATEQVHSCLKAAIASHLQSVIGLPPGDDLINMS